jgi:hypothetical protein
VSIRPIFLFSISRTGSTLVQRILAAHEGIATVSEPWLLLPGAYTLRPRGIDAEYVHPLLFTAIEDFAATLPGGAEDYREELRDFALRLYRKAAGEGDHRYFLDKSPPYCLVAEEIIRIFPEAKYVFLWRNPLAVVASMIDTWGPWRPNLMSSDLFTGLPRLLAAEAANRERCHAVRFEDLVPGNEDAWRGLCDYLEVDFEPHALADFEAVELNGRMGDPNGGRRYRGLSAEPAVKWKRTLGNPLRRAWCQRYLSFLGDERLDQMGYDGASLRAELRAQPRCYEGLSGDLGRALRDLATEPIRVRTSGRRIGAPSPIRELFEARPAGAGR